MRYQFLVLQNEIYEEAYSNEGECTHSRTLKELNEALKIYNAQKLIIVDY